MEQVSEEVEFEVRKNGEWVLTSLDLSDAIAAIKQEEGDFEVFKVIKLRSRIMKVPKK